jgi:branched-chain amino acid transport system substrate-binding protein
MRATASLHLTQTWDKTKQLTAVVLCLGLVACSSTDVGGPSAPISTQSSATRVITDIPKFEPMPKAEINAPPLATTPEQAKITTPTAAPVKVGLLVPLTGAQASLGQSMLNAAQLALADLNANHVTLIPRDTNPSAPQAAQQAVRDGAKVMLGPIFAANVREVENTAANNRIPVLAFSTDWTIANQKTAILGFLPFSQVARIVDFAAQKGGRQFAILIPETPYGMAVAGAVRDTLQRQNLPKPIEVRFNDKTLTAAAQALGGQRFDTLVLPIGGKALNSVATVLRQNDVPLQSLRIIGTGLWDEDAVATSGIIDGAYYAAPDPAKRTAFIKRYQDLYGSKPPRLSTLAYDATALVSVLAARGYDPADPNNLHYPAGFTGIDGVFRIRPDNLNDRSLAVLQIKGTRAVVVDPAPAHF